MKIIMLISSFLLTAQVFGLTLNDLENGDPNLIRKALSQAIHDKKLDCINYTDKLNWGKTNIGGLELLLLDKNYELMIEEDGVTSVIFQRSINPYDTEALVEVEFVLTFDLMEVEKVNIKRSEIHFEERRIGPITNPVFEKVEVKELILDRACHLN